ncbi:MAG: hypothetical protein U9N57_01115 [Pseudomonadota bacterium]|nr:hypothetical protein [Pseudomonadota bacterium]
MSPALKAEDDSKLIKSFKSIEDDLKGLINDLSMLDAIEGEPSILNEPIIKLNQAK